MGDGAHTIEIRGRAALVFCFVTLALPMVLNSLGLADYDSERSADDPYRPADRSLAERFCFISEWMAPACLLAWATAQFRLRNSILFEEKSSRFLPLALGSAGLALLTVNWLRWASRPYSREYFGALQGWQFGLGWLLLWWSYVFWPTVRSGQCSRSPVSKLKSFSLGFPQRQKKRGR